MKFPSTRGTRATAAASTPTSARRPPRSSPTSRSPRSSGRRSRPSPASSRPPPCCSSTACAGSTPRSGSTRASARSRRASAPPTRRASCAAASATARTWRRSRCGAASSRPRGTPRRSSPGRAPTTSSRRPPRTGRPRPPSCCRRHCRCDLAKVEAEVAGQGPRGGRAAATTCSCWTGSCRGPHPLPRAIGFVKSHDTTYLDSTLGAVVGGLAAGERTPVFRIERPFPVYSWYLRLPGAIGGTVVGGRADRVRRRAARPRPRSRSADLAQVTLVRYASAEYKDARAPQNLYPIAGLERGAAAAPRRARPALPRAAGRGGLTGLRQRRRHPPQQHRVVAAGQQLGLLDGLGAPPDRPVRAAQLLGIEHGLAVERRGRPARRRSAITSRNAWNPTTRTPHGNDVAPYPSRLVTPPSSTAHASTAGTCRAWLAHGRDVLDRRPGEHGVAVVGRDVEHRRAEGRAAERRGPTDCHGPATVGPRRPVRHHPTGLSYRR